MNMKDDITRSNVKAQFGAIFEMITNPKDKEKLTAAIKELSNSMVRMDAERDFQKEAIANVSDETGIDKKYVKKLATIYHKQTFAQVQTETEEIETLYETLFG
jgi:glutaminase